MNNNILFVSGIDTNIGKSYATGFLAKKYINEGKKVITQKLIQTGNAEISEDIELHRKIMGIGFTEDDHTKLTMPEIFSFPASPHLASKLDNRKINFEKIESATKILSKKYDIVILEGAGGLMVPLTEDFLTIDYIAQHHYPVILVTSGRLGSINHTLLSLEALQKRNIKLHSLIFNMNDSEDTFITNDTIYFLKNYLIKTYPECEFIILPKINL